MSTHLDTDLRVAPDGMDFFIENIGADASPQQYIRELTQNSLDAIEKTGKSGKVFWRVAHDGKVAPKLQLIDNGVGMTGEEMVEYINQLASSSREKSLTGNFGIGAKITAGVMNPHGLVYVSWKNGVGSKVHFWKNPETGRYGLKPLQRKDGSMGLWTDIVGRGKPKDIISQHGTQVTLMGLSDDDDTSIPQQKDLGSNWVSRYLNSRYFMVPDNVHLRVASDPTVSFENADWIEGQSIFLEENSISQGVVPVSGAKAHWWLLGEVKRNDPIENKGHVGVVFQDELYDTRFRKSGHATLSQAGVIAGPDRVVIYFEPKPNGQIIKPSTARGGILINAQPAPYAEWAAELSEKLPVELTQYIDGILHKSPEDASERLRLRLQPLSKLFEFSAYQPASNGEEEIEISPDGLQEGAIENEERNGRGSSQPDKPEKDVTQGLRDLFKPKENGSDAEYQKGKKVETLVLPATRWVSDDADDELTERAAKYDRKSNVIVINKSFRGYEDLLAHLKKDYSTDERTQKAIENTLNEYYSQVLVQSVLGVRGLSKNAAQLPVEYETTLLTPESLTTSVMVRVEIHTNVVNALRAEGIKPLLPKGRAPVIG